MKTSRLAKSVIAGAVIIGMSATGVTVWAATASTGTSSLNANASLNNNTSTAQSLQADYDTYVLTMYQQIQSALNAHDDARAQQLIKTVEKELSIVNADIQQAQPNAADQILQTAVTAATTTASTNSGTSNSTANNTVTSTGATTNNTTSTNTTNTSSSTSDDTTSASQPEDNDKGDLGHETVALAAALQHVTNPHAQASLEKNILKGFTHLEAQIQQQVPQTENRPVQNASQTSSSNSTEQNRTNILAQVTVVPSSTPTSSLSATENSDDEASDPIHTTVKTRGSKNNITSDFAHDTTQHGHSQEHSHGHGKGHDHDHERG